MTTEKNQVTTCIYTRISGHAVRSKCKTLLITDGLSHNVTQTSEVRRFPYAYRK